MFVRPLLPAFLDLNDKQKSHIKGIGCSRGVTFVSKNRKTEDFMSFFPQKLMSQCSFVLGFLSVRGRPFEMSGENTKTKK